MLKAVVMAVFEGAIVAVIAAMLGSEAWLLLGMGFGLLAFAILSDCFFGNGHRRRK